MTHKAIHVDYKIDGVSNDGTINICHFDTDEQSSKNRIMLSFLERNQEPAFITIPDNKIVRVAAAMFAAGTPEVEPDTLHLDSTTKFEWNSFAGHLMGRGFVAYKQSEQEKADGQSDPHIGLVHINAESNDPDVIRMVENECAMLAYLLNKFRFDNDFISETAKECAV